MRSNTWLVVSQLLSTYGPAPTGFFPKPFESAFIAVGEPTYASSSATTWSNDRSGAASWIVRRVGSTTVRVTPLSVWACRDSRVGSASRSQLNFTAAASSGVPSLNLTFGRSSSVHSAPSAVVSDLANWGVTVPLFWVKTTSGSYSADIRCPSPYAASSAVAGSSEIESACTATTMLPPRLGAGVPGVVGGTGTTGPLLEPVLPVPFPPPLPLNAAAMATPAPASTASAVTTATGSQTLRPPGSRSSRPGLSGAGGCGA